MKNGETKKARSRQELDIPAQQDNSELRHEGEAWEITEGMSYYSSR